MLKVEKSKNGFIFTVFDNKESSSIEISQDEFFHLEDLIRYERHKIDILSYIQNHKLSVDEDVLERVCEIYHELREENDGDAYGLSSDECLKLALLDELDKLDEVEEDIDNEKYFLF